MPADCNTSLLILQDRDMNLQRIERDLAALPTERESTKTKIANWEQQIEEGRQKIKEIEAHGKTLETEMASLEEQIVKYKNQQLQVKKNEEYQALIHEIETAQGKISDLEEKEIELLYDLDEARKNQSTDEAEKKEQIEAETRFLGRLDEKESNLKGEIDQAKSALAEAESQVEKPAMSIYRRVSRGLKFPIIVPQRDAKCQGCHMRVSAAVEVEVKKGAEITTCDNCGRILYWEG